MTTIKIHSLRRKNNPLKIVSNFYTGLVFPHCSWIQGMAFESGIGRFVYSCSLGSSRDDDPFYINSPECIVEVVE